MAFCHSCGSELRGSDRFCGECGTGIDDDLPEAVQTSSSLPLAATHRPAEAASSSGTFNGSGFIYGFLAFATTCIAMVILREVLKQALATFLIQQSLLPIPIGYGPEEIRYRVYLPISFVEFCLLLFLSVKLWSVMFNLRVGMWPAYLAGIFFVLAIEDHYWRGSPDFTMVGIALVGIGVFSGIWAATRSSPA